MSLLPSLSKEFFTFIKDNIKADTSKLLLKYHASVVDFNIDFAVVQISCRQKNSKKLRSFISNPSFLFPTSLSAEQSSHEAVSKYHSGYIKEGDTLLDLTAGLGIDIMSMAGKCRKAIACEIDPLKAEILRHNVRVLGISNLSVMTADSTEWIRNCKSHFNVIFIDPARRGANNSRTYGFQDCQPDILGLQDLLLDKCDTLLIKGSPLLDISKTLKDIRGVSSIKAISVNGECKEILIEARRCDDNTTFIEPVLEEAIDLNEDGSIKSKFSFYRSSIASEYNNEIFFAEEKDLVPGTYLYEPNSTVMKLAPWGELCKKYEGIVKLAPSSHLFISEKNFDNFPGRILRIERIIEKKDRKSLKNLPANVSVRNYPLSAEELRKQLGVKEGKDLFIYGTRLINPTLILAKKISNSES